MREGDSSRDPLEVEFLNRCFCENLCTSRGYHERSCSIRDQTKAVLLVVLTKSEDGEDPIEDGVNIGVKH